IPRDRTVVAEAAIEGLTLTDKDGTFFAPPVDALPEGQFSSEEDYQIETPITLTRLFFKQGPGGVRLGDAEDDLITSPEPAVRGANHAAVLYRNEEQKEEANRNLYFDQFLRECFVREWKDGVSGKLAQPGAVEIGATLMRLPEDRAEAGRILREAGV